MQTSNLPAKPMDRFKQELRGRGFTKLQPTFYLSSEWGVVEGTTAIAIPFYLADERLRRVQETIGGIDVDVNVILRLRLLLLLGLLLVVDLLDLGLVLIASLIFVIIIVVIVGNFLLGSLLLVEFDWEAVLTMEKQKPNNVSNKVS
mgnify:CR=1 FL=1